jgi:AraC-like DNA-binding protein
MSSSATTHEHVQDMLDQIHEHYTQRVTLATLARRLGRQSAYLGRLFRDEIGMTVHEYITRARVVFGAAQVRCGAKIEAVALELGYRSKKNFYRQFKRRFGMTPDAYRHAHLEAGSHMPASGAPPLRQYRFSASRMLTLVRRANLLARDGAQATDLVVPSAASSQRMVRALLSQRIAMLATDETGRCVAANEAAVSISGYSVDELRGMPAANLFASGMGSDPGSHLHILFPISSSLPANAVFRTKSAATVQVHLTGAENLLGTARSLRPVSNSER